MIEVKGKGKLLRKFTLSELNTFLSSLAQLVGVVAANLPDVNAMKLLMNSVIQLYGHLTDQEVKNAFNLLIAGQIEVDGHYQNFSAKYFSDVVREYLDYAVKTLKEIPEVIEEKQLPPVKQTDEEFIEENYLMWFNLKNKFYQYVNHRVYDKLVSAGLLSLSEDDKIRIRAAIKADNSSMQTHNRFQELCHRLTEIKDAPDDQYMNRLCKKYAVAEYFNKLIEQGKLKVFENEK